MNGREASISVSPKRPGPPDKRKAPAGPGGAPLGAPDLLRAVSAPLPARLAPQLATLATSAPTNGQWIVENKFDGYRLLARLEHGKARLFTRNGHDWTAKLGDLAAAVEALGLDSGWLDGEIVIPDENGIPSFNRLQNAIDSSTAKDLVYYLFDVPYLADSDLRLVPLAGRRAVLQSLLADKASDRVRVSDAFDAPVEQLLDAACRMGLEGVMLKRADAPYVSGRSATWLKLKCQRSQDFVVVGFTERAGAVGEAGGLLLGHRDDAGVLRFAGSVGTGWGSSGGADLHRRLVELQTKQPAVDPATTKPGRWSKRAAGTERWVRPELVVEVAFAEWTPEGHIRHPTFRGIRGDEKPLAGQKSAAATRTATKRTTAKVTHPDRVIDPSTGLKKVDLVRFYENIAERIVPHLKGRPVSLVRAPQGIEGELFFQKHLETKMPGVVELDAGLWPGHSALLGIDSPDALLAAAQMNTVEFHTWNSSTRSIDQPDRVIFDLDPGEGVTWAHVQEAAMLMRVLLTEIGLTSWLKTSGGKGLHVVVPLAPKLDYDVVKGFSQAAVQHMARTFPQRFVAKSGGTNRVGRIFIDYLRNGHGQTTAAAFSVRARPGLGVSMPVGWEQLPELKSGAQWTIRTAREYLSFEQVDPWAGYWKSRQTLGGAMKRLGFEPGG